MKKDEEQEAKENEEKDETESVTKDAATAAIDATEESLEETGEEKEDAKPEKSKKLLFIIVAVVVFLCVLVGVFFLTPLGDFVMGDDDPDAQRRKIAGLQAQAVTYLRIPELTINLKKTTGSSRTLTASFVLAIENENIRKNVNNFVPMIQDQFNTFLREMNVSDLEGIAGIERVSQEMLIRINRVVAPFSVQDVLVQKFYIR